MTKSIFVFHWPHAGDVARPIVFAIWCSAALATGGFILAGIDAIDVSMTHMDADSNGMIPLFAAIILLIPTTGFAAIAFLVRKLQRWIIPPAMFFTALFAFAVGIIGANNLANGRLIVALVAAVTTGLCVGLFVSLFNSFSAIRRIQSDDFENDRGFEVLRR